MSGERRSKRIVTVLVIIAVAAVAAGILAVTVIVPKMNYDKAVSLQESGRYDEAFKAFAALGNYGDSAAKAGACRSMMDYQAAMALRQAGQYEEAIEAFTALGDYGDSEAQIAECMEGIMARDYESALALRQTGQYGEAVAALEALGGYSDAEAQIAETRYQWAGSLTASGDYAEAVAVYSLIRGFRDVDSLIENDAHLSEAAAKAREEQLKPYRTAGSYVTYGVYPQTASGGDSTPVEWLVLDVQGEKALLLSRYGLDVQPYHTTLRQITWEECTLRAWLNETFINAAFTPDEQQAILTTAVDNGDGQRYTGWNTVGGNDTEDRIFLLSYAEANQYLGVQYYRNDDRTNTRSRVTPTAYAMGKGAWTSDKNKTADGDPAGVWWLRSPGALQDEGADVSAEGALAWSSSVDYSCDIVRPALWVDTAMLSLR